MNIFLLIIFACYIVAEKVTVTTKYGQINGYTTTIIGKKLNLFKGIPYAEPPLGELRFKRPIPIQKSWNDPINATQWPNSCMQPQLLVQAYNLSLSEDCLYLNVFVPSSNSSNKLKSVMLWIHGGGLIFGYSGKDYPVIAVNGDVIVVSINYRLSAFGFLYTGNDDAPGNVGLYDQVMALQWVKDNIENFGGDPNDVTIFGGSAGGWCVTLHLISPLSRHLFKNAIMMSGSALNDYSVQEPKTAKRLWVKSAHMIGCGKYGTETELTKEAIECIKNIEPEKLAQIPLLNIASVIMGMDPMLVYGDEFLPKKPIQMLKTGNYKKNVNLLMGTVQDEGSILLTFMLNLQQFEHDHINITYEVAYQILKTHINKLTSHVAFNGEDVIKLYFKGIHNNDGDILSRTIGTAIGDYYFTCPSLIFAKLLYEGDHNSNVFQYYYTRKIDDLFCRKWMGSCHASDFSLVLGDPFLENSIEMVAFSTNYTEDDRIHSKVLMDAYSHFAKKGYPPPQDGIQWSSYYTINGQTIAPYYEFSKNTKREGNFGKGLKYEECHILWNKYIDN